MNYDFYKFTNTIPISDKGLSFPWMIIPPLVGVAASIWGSSGGGGESPIVIHEPTPTPTPFPTGIIVGTIAGAFALIIVMMVMMSPKKKEKK